jgi:hypothetical protein
MNHVKHTAQRTPEVLSETSNTKSLEVLSTTNLTQHLAILYDIYCLMLLEDASRFSWNL